MEQTEDETVTSGSDRIYDSINELAAALTGADNLSTKLGKVVNELRRITQADGVSIWLTEGHTLWCIAGKGHYENMEKGKPDEAKYDLGTDDGLTVWIAKSGETVNIKSNAELTRHPQWKGKYDTKNYPNRDKQEGRRCESFIGTPLTVGTTILGVLKADNRKGDSDSPGVFSEGEVRLFRILAALTAIVIRNDQIQLEANLKEADARRKRAEMEARQTMAAISVHNLDNPTTTVRNALQNVKDGLFLIPIPLDRIRHSIDNALHEVRRILETRNTFLALIKPKHSEEYQETNVQAFVEDVIQDARLGAPDVEAVFENPENVSRLQLPLSALRVALDAVIQNAVDATRQQKYRRVVVGLRLERTAGKIAISGKSVPGVSIDVCDNGPGVPADIRDRLFLVGTTTKELGAGLGLFASRKLLQSVQGDITYDPEYTPGARFVIRLEIREEEP